MRGAHALKPQVAARDVEHCNRAVDRLRCAFRETGHTHLSFATALGMQRQHVTRWFDRTQRRPMSAALRERARTNAETVDVVRWLEWLEGEAEREVRRA